MTEYQMAVEKVAIALHSAYEQGTKEAEPRVNKLCWSETGTFRQRRWRREAKKILMDLNISTCKYHLVFKPKLASVKSKVRKCNPESNRVLPADPNNYKDYVR